jgi:hypothetical protein
MSTPKDNSFRLSIDNETTILEHPITMGAQLRVPTEKMAAQYFNSTKRDSGILPPVVRYVSPDFKGFLLERPPFEALLKIRFNVKGSSDILEEFMIHIPWTVLYVKFSDPELVGLEEFRIYFRNTPIYSEDDGLFVAPLPNLWSEGKVCDANVFEKSLKHLPSKEPSAIINCILNMFWDSEFNMDLIPSDKVIPGRLLDGHVSDGSRYSMIKHVLKTWSSLSLTEVLEIEYKPMRSYTVDENLAGIVNPITVRDLMQQLNPSVISDAGTTGQPFLEYMKRLALTAANR